VPKKTTVFGYPWHNPQAYANASLVYDSMAFAIKVSKVSHKLMPIQNEKSINKQINNRASLSWQVKEFNANNLPKESCPVAALA